MPTHTTLGRRRREKKRQTHEGAGQTRGEGGTETTRPRAGTATDRHHKATTRQTKGGGGKTRPRQHPHTPKPLAAPQGVMGNRLAPPPKTESQENQRADENPTHTHTHHPARNGGVQAGHTHKRTKTPTPCQEWHGTAETRAQHTRPHRTSEPGMAGYKGGAHPNTHTPQHPSQEWRGAAATQAQANTPAPHPRPGGERDWAGQAHKHTHAPTPHLRVAGRSRNPSPSTHTLTAHPSRERRVTGRARTQPRTPQKPQPRMVGCRPKPKPNCKHGDPQPAEEGRNHNPYPNTATQDPSQGWRGYRNPSPNTTQTQTQTPHNSRKPSVHSPGTEAARAMRVTPPNEIRSPGVRLHPQACTALGLEAERATPKRLGTSVPRTCMHALGTGYARKSAEALGFRAKQGTCASTGAQRHGETSMSRWQRSALPVFLRAALLAATSQV